MLASNEPVYDSIKLKLVYVSSAAQRLFDAVRNGVTDPSHSADRMRLNKKHWDSRDFVPALLWLKSKVQLV